MKTTALRKNVTKISPKMSPKNKMKKEQTPEFKKILDRIKSKKSRAKDEKGQNEMMKNDGDENESFPKLFKVMSEVFASF